MKQETIGRSKSIVLTPNHLMDVISSLDSTYQLNIFLLLIEKLKNFAQKEFNTYLAGQKALDKQEVLILEIPLSSISNPSEYRDVKKAFFDMGGIQCKITFKENNEAVEWKGNLFNVEFRSKARYSSNIKIKMDIVIARLFINFNRNQNLIPEFYSKIDTNIRLHTKFKNIIKLYLYLSLWRNKPFIKVKLSDLCDYLGLSTAYYNPSNFKKHILEPSYLILKGFNDVWYDLDNAKIKKNEFGVYMIYLEVLNKEMIQIEDKRKNQIVNFLTIHFNFTLKDLNEVDDIIKSVPKDHLIEKLSDLIPHVNKVKHKAEYTKTALKNAFRH